MKPAHKPRPDGLVSFQAAVYAATRNVRRPLDDLFAWVHDRRNLEAAWERVRAADGADTPGPDGVTCAQIAPRIADWLKRLIGELTAGVYRPAAPRFVDVPKPDKPGATRRLGILTVRDRLVAAALKQVLEPVLEPIFLPESFGFRPGRSVPGALEEAIRRLSAGSSEAAPFDWAAHLDIAQCFDTIDHIRLFDALARHVADSAMLDLIGRFASAGSITVGWWCWKRRCGLVQGSSLSPLLCNLALHPLDVALGAFARQSGGAFTALRYADDLLLLARERFLLSRGTDVLRRTLAGLRQSLRSDLQPRTLVDGVDWLGVVLRRRHSSWNGRAEFGYVVPEFRVRRMLERLTEMTEPPSERIAADAFHPAGWIRSLNEQLRDWLHAYRYADNAADVFRAIDEHARARLGALLQAITGRRRRRLAAEYYQRLPRGFWTWQVDGVALLCLAAQPPARPQHLTHRPPWMRSSLRRAH